MKIKAQSGKVVFTGRVLDEETREPVPYAAVQIYVLPDSTFITGGATGADGRFSLSATARKAVKISIHVSYVGYTAIDRTLNYSDRKIGDICLAPDGFMLEETVITGKAPMAVTENDTTVYNSSAFRTPEGSMLEELVKQLPGGEITADGKLMIQGKEVKKILVDGKEFFSDDPQAALKNLPVEMVEKLKAYERKSDLARLTGIDDGEEEMILDLSVKKDMKKGWMDNFLGGMGSKERYEVANTMNRIRENSQLTVIANWNNTNNQGFSELQQQSSNATGNTRGRAGMGTSRSLGFNFSKDWGNIKFRSNVQYSGTDREEESKTLTDNFMKAEKSITNSTSSSRNRNDGVTGNAYLEWKIDTVTNLIFRPTFRYSTADRRGASYQKSWSGEEELNEKESSNWSESSQYSLGTFVDNVKIEEFEDEWVQVSEEVKYDHHGKYRLVITRIRDGKVLIDNTQNDIDTWRKGAINIRNKFGIYRSYGGSGGQITNNIKDETIDLADFVIYEKDTNPSPAAHD